MEAMNIPAGLRQIREATTSEAATALLAAGWQLITVAQREPSRDGNLVYVLGWTSTEKPPAQTRPDRTSGNLADNARQ